MNKKWIWIGIGTFLLMAMVVIVKADSSLPWVEVWVTVRDGMSGELLTDAQVENLECASLPPDSCTQYGVWSEEKQAFILRVPRLEPYEITTTRDGYSPVVLTGTATDPVITREVLLYPSDDPLRLGYLPLILKSGSLPPEEYNPTEAVERLNWWRSLAGVSPVSGNPELHSNCRAHARYMTHNTVLSHSEDEGLPNYTTEGEFCGQAAAVTFGINVYPTDAQAVDVIMGSPFHALTGLDPRLSEVGFGSDRVDTFWDGSYAAAALDVFHGLDWGQELVRVTFPQDGGTLPFTSYNGLAQPDPLTACPGYTAPTGAALLVINAPSASLVSSTLTRGSTLLEHCVIDNGNYTNPNQDLMLQGITALGELGAVMVIPRQPLLPNRTYTVTLTYNNGEIVSWSFTTNNSVNILPMQVLLPNAD